MAEKKDRIQELEVGEFVRRLKRMLSGESLAAFFLGAGASRSSGIPTAAALAERWAHQLHLECAPERSFDDWVPAVFPRYAAEDPGASYSEVMTRLFQTAADRQEEIERLVAGKDPAFGYATFAQLLAHPSVGSRCNVVFTTNFDDLVADALYLYTETKPLVVGHASLADFATTGRRRPTIVKVHGDAMLAPLNGPEELARLDGAYSKVLQSLLRDRALIFIGYGGHDEGVSRALESLPDGTITRGIYWINPELPDTQLGAWLRKGPESFWVRHLDFDKLMVVIKREFDLPNPDLQRFEALMRRYHETFSALQVNVAADTGAPGIVRVSVDDTANRFTNWWGIDSQARSLRAIDPARANEVYQQGIAQFPESSELLGSYAVFLETTVHDRDAAEEMYLKSIALRGDDPMVLGNFATFLAVERRDRDGAETYFERALAAAPDHAQNLGNYALFLSQGVHSFAQVRDLYERSLRSETRSDVLASYATYLWTEGNDPMEAEHTFQRALDLTFDEPATHANALCNYAGMLWALGRPEEARRRIAEIPTPDLAGLIPLEVAIYRLCNDGLQSAPWHALLAQARELLIEGVRSPGWSFEANIRSAIEAGAADETIALLRALAAVASDAAPIESLDEFEEWRELSDE